MKKHSSPNLHCSRSIYLTPKHRYYITAVVKRLESEKDEMGSEKDKLPYLNLFGVGLMWTFKNDELKNGAVFVLILNLFIEYI